MDYNLTLKGYIGLDTKSNCDEVQETYSKNISNRERARERARARDGLKIRIVLCKNKIINGTSTTSMLTFKIYQLRVSN